MNDKTPSVLYVEDDGKSRQLVELLVARGLQWPCTLFEDTTNFMSRLEHMPTVPDIVLLDVQIAPIGGFEVLSLLRADVRYRSLCVVAMTASVMTDEIHALRVAGFNGLIGKPIKINVFQKTLRALLAGEELWVVL